MGTAKAKAAKQPEQQVRQGSWGSSCSGDKQWKPRPGDLRLRGGFDCEAKGSRQDGAPDTESWGGPGGAGEIASARLQGRRERGRSFFCGGFSVLSNKDSYQDCFKSC